ncbi:hypothetical protein [Paenibacillus sp.]|uniref:hypothetical protein n=1 Tax=Paenibacillus sp. TaxID=58172 RepID=UPI002D5C2934|nr:hypothetical protein [Paenibacillus sp.]HZG84148.1 hypothetical protein [Paenibacillus sp.]
MNAWGTKALMAVVLAIVCVFIGIEIAAMGIERVQGPLLAGEPAGARTPIAVFGGGSPAKDAAQAGPGEGAASTAAAGASAGTAGAASASAGTAGSSAGTAGAAGAAAAGDVEPSSLIYRFSLWLGDTLRYVAKGVLRFIAAVFDAVIH